MNSDNRLEGKKKNPQQATINQPDWAQENLYDGIRKKKLLLGM